MSTRQLPALAVIAAMVASWPVAAVWFLLMVLIGIGLDSLLTPAAAGDLVRVFAVVASLPITAIPGLLAGLVAGQRGRVLLRPAVGGMVGALCALLAPIGSVVFFALTVTAIPIGSSVGLILGARRVTPGPIPVPPPPPPGTPAGAPPPPPSETQAQAPAASAGPAVPPPPPRHGRRRRKTGLVLGVLGALVVSGGALLLFLPGGPPVPEPGSARWTGPLPPPASLDDDIDAQRSDPRPEAVGPGGEDPTGEDPTVSPDRMSMSQQEVADAFLRAFLAEDPDAARRYTLPGQEPDAYTYLEANWRGSEFLAEHTDCLSDTLFCDFSQGVTGADVLVVEPVDGTWTVTGAGLSLIGPALWDGDTASLVPGCSTRDAKLRTGPGTEYPAMHTLPAGTCRLFLDPEQPDDGWTALRTDDRPGFLPSDAVEPAADR